MDAGHKERIDKLETRLRDADEQIKQSNDRASKQQQEIENQVLECKKLCNEKNAIQQQLAESIEANKQKDAL